MLNVQDPAPLSIPFIDEQGHTRTLGDWNGMWRVVYFYPKDNTPGCTLEAEGFRDRHAEFRAHDAVVIGVSKDTCASHQKFIAKQKLPFVLAADTGHTLMEAFGTWGERSFMGRKYMGTSRSTFLIDPSGRITHVWGSVKPAGHPEEVLAALIEVQRGER